MKTDREWLVADDAHRILGTTRSWLRDKWKAGYIRRREIEGYDRNGARKVKLLYCVADIERELSKTENGGEANEDV